MRSNSETDRNNSTQYKVNGFYFYRKFFKKSDKFLKYARAYLCKGCYSDPLLEPGKIWLYKVVTIHRHLYGGGGEFVPTSIQTSVKFKQL